MLKKMIVLLLMQIKKPYAFAFYEETNIEVHLSGNAEEAVCCAGGIIEGIMNGAEPEIRAVILEALREELNFMVQKYIREEQDDQSDVERE